MTSDIILMMYLTTYEEHGDAILVRDEARRHGVCGSAPRRHATHTRSVFIRRPTQRRVPRGLFTVGIRNIEHFTERIVQVHGETTGYGETF
jgi:hypothetical protein